jgi:hypothetical protein
MAFLSTHLNRREITIDSSLIDSNINDLPIMVKLIDGVNIDMAKTKVDGSDVFFTADDGTTILEFERETHDTIGGEGVYWVRIPTVDSVTDTKIYVYYDDTTIEVDQEDAVNTWTSDYRLVLHMDDATPTTIPDSTSNGNTANKSGSNNPLEVDSDMGKGQLFDGATSIVTVPSHASVNINQPLTWSIWINWNGVNGQSQDLVTKWRNPYDLKITIDDSATGGGGFRLAWGGIFRGSGFSNASVNDGLLHLVEVTSDGANTRIYVDNVLQETIPGTPGSGAGIDIGNEAGTIHEFNGTMPEFRLASVVKSDAFRKADYNSGIDNLLAFGSEEVGTSSVTEDVTTDIRAIGLGLEDVTTDIRIKLEDVLADLNTDIRAIANNLHDLNTDIRIQFTPVTEDISSDIRAIAQNTEI